MKIIFLCYKTDPKTGLSKVAAVHQNEDYVKEFLTREVTTSKRVEEWIIDDISTINGKALIGEFYSITGFEGRDVE